MSAGQPSGAGDAAGHGGFGDVAFLNQAAHIAILDSAGRILQVNEAWNAFADANDLAPTYRFLGTDYLAVCRDAAARDGPGSEGAAEACDGIAAVLEGRRPRFSLVYPCHAPHHERWFLMFARPFPAPGAGAIVSHIDVTSLKLAGWVPDETHVAVAAATSPEPATVGLPFAHVHDVVLRLQQR
jgi:hypothetical protein